MKRCSKCKITKDSSCFHVDRTNVSGFRSWCKQCANEHVRIKYWKDPIKSAEILRQKSIKYNYGISNEEYMRIFLKQEGKCAICGKHQSEIKKRLFIDHDHTSGKIRGLLCRQCNSILGYSYDNMNILLQSIKYLNSSI